MRTNINLSNLKNESENGKEKNIEVKPATQITANIATRFQLSEAISVAQQVNEKIWTAEQASRLSGLLNRSVLRANSNAIYLPTDVTVEGGVVSAEGTPMKIVFRNRQGVTLNTISAEQPLALTEVSRISITGSNAVQDVSATVT